MLLKWLLLSMEVCCESGASYIARPDPRAQLSFSERFCLMRPIGGAFSGIIRLLGLEMISVDPALDLKLKTLTLRPKPELKTLNPKA